MKKFKWRVLRFEHSLIKFNAMPADKKIKKDKLPLPEKEDKRHQSQEEFDDVNKVKKEKMKPKKVNYVVKDLPIY